MCINDCEHFQLQIISAVAILTRNRYPGCTAVDLRSILMGLKFKKLSLFEESLALLPGVHGWMKNRKWSQEECSELIHKMIENEVGKLSPSKHFCLI